jgi:hypothetical protein
MSKNVFARPGRRSAALMSVAALATTALVGTAFPAGAALVRGAQDDATGAPAYFADTEGLRLQLCVDACQEVAEPGGPAPDPVTANHAAYYAAEATAGPFDLAWEVATIPAEDPVTEEELAEVGGVENAVSIQARDLTPNRRFRVQTPHGNYTVRSDNRGEVDFSRVSGGEAGSPLRGPVQFFLRSVRPSGGMIGDAELATRVTGARNGFNRIRITGPNVNARTARFFLSGQLAENTPMTSVSDRRLRMGSKQTRRASKDTVSLASFGTRSANVRVRLVGPNRGRFTLNGGQRSLSRTVRSGGAMAINVKYQPRPNRNSAATLVVRDGNVVRNIPLKGVGFKPRR